MGHDMSHVSSGNGLASHMPLSRNHTAHWNPLKPPHVSYKVTNHSVRSRKNERISVRKTTSHILDF